jgi:uncharacterized protein YkwD
LRLVPELRCSARLHSLDMVTRGYTNTTNQQGLRPDDRVAATGFPFTVVGEVIGDQQRGSDVQQVVDDLLSGWEGCMIIANPAFTAVGVGRFGGRWTLDFVAEPP